MPLDAGQLDRLDELVAKAIGQVAKMQSMIDSLRPRPPWEPPPRLPDRHNPDLDDIFGV